MPLLWIALLHGHAEGCSLAATTGVHSAVEAIKYLMAGADVVMSYLGAAAARSGVLFGAPRGPHALDGPEGIRLGRPVAWIDEPSRQRATRAHSSAATTSGCSKATGR